MDSLKYRQGRPSFRRSRAVAGGLLGIKPVICLEDGKVKLAGQARGLPGAYVAMFKLIDEKGRH